jgi:hypothetical protein
MFRHAVIPISLITSLLILGCAGNSNREAEISSPSPEATSVSVAATPVTSSNLETNFQQAIDEFMKTEDVPTDMTQDVLSEFIDLNGDGDQDAIVVLTGSYWCGTGGCTMLVFQGGSGGFELVSRSSLIRPPITVSDTQTNGWRDLIVTVSGGGIPSKTVALKFDGQEYPLNPSDQPPLSSDEPVQGTIILSEGSEPQDLPPEASQGDLQSYDEPTMPIAAQYPDTMTLDALCSGEGCGYFFKFKPENSELEQAEVHLFLPNQAETADDAEIGLDSLLESNNWQTVETITPEIEFEYPWLKKVIPFQADNEMMGYILIGETNDQGIRVTLLYPKGSSETFIPAAITVLDNLEFKPENLPILNQG